MPLCAQCPGRNFVDDNALRMHRRSKKHGDCKCRYCDRAFATEIGRETHEMAKHPPTFECKYCDLKFPTDEGRLAHQMTKHSKYDCRYCDRTFNSEDAREQHEDVKHLFECRYCDRMFGSEDGREEHEDKIHFVFKCQDCVNTWFTSDQALEAHTQAVHRNLLCSTCGRQFGSQQARSQHEEDKHRKRPQVGSLTLIRAVPGISCDYCRCTMTSQAARDAHLRSCSYNPANRVTQPTWTMSTRPTLTRTVQPVMSIGSVNQYSDDESESGTAETESPSCSVVRDEDEESELPSTIEAREDRFGDEASVPPGSPSCLSGSTSGEGEMFHSTGSISPIITIGEATPAEKSCGCSICQRTPSPSSHGDIRVSDDAAHPVLVCDHHQGDPADHHDGILRCIPCLMLFDTADALQKHVCASRTALLRYHCPICYSQFDDEPSLQRHLEGVEFTCQHCLIRCCSDEMLQDHLLSHPTCGKCSQSFINNLALCAHVESSHPVVVCWDCDGVVVDQADLASHYATSPVHPSCSSCGLGTKDAVEMDEHVKRVHAAIEEGGVGSLGAESPLEANQSEAFDRSRVHTDVGPGDVSREVPSLAVPTLVDDDANTRAGASPSPTPSEHGSNASRPLVSPVSFDTASLTSLSDASPSLVFVSAEGIPEYVRDNRAILVATSARPPASAPSAEGSGSPRLSSTSSSAAGEARAGAVPKGYRLHCRICLREPCEDVTATICGHLFCKRCITQAVVATSMCPVCRSATLLYCLFKLDLSA